MNFKIFVFAWLLTKKKIPTFSRTSIRHYFPFKNGIDTQKKIEIFYPFRLIKSRVEYQIK